MCGPKSTTNANPDTLPTPTNSWRPPEKSTFVVYRCDYSDDILWRDYMRFFKQAVKNELADIGAPQVVWPCLHWTVVEDPASLAGASRERIHALFSALNEERVIIQLSPEGSCQCVYEHMSCVHVDQWCLETLNLHEEWLDRGAPGPFKPVLCAVIHNARTPDGEERDAIPLTGGGRSYTGWGYTHVSSLSNLCPHVSQWLQNHPLDRHGLHAHAVFS